MNPFRIYAGGGFNNQFLTFLIQQGNGATTRTQEALKDFDSRLHDHFDAQIPGYLLGHVYQGGHIPQPALGIGKETGIFNSNGRLVS
jgi:hypothetical protein